MLRKGGSYATWFILAVIIYVVDGSLRIFRGLKKNRKRSILPSDTNFRRGEMSRIANTFALAFVFFGWVSFFLTLGEFGLLFFALSVVSLISLTRRKQTTAHSY